MRFAALFVAAFLTLAALTATAHAQQPLRVTFATAPTTGRYYPAHVLAAWVIAADGTFERTLHVWAARRRAHLAEWVTARNSRDLLDGISSATLRTNATQELRWDMVDTGGATVPDGEYLIHFEYADTNSTRNNLRSVFPFTKGPADFDATASNAPYVDVHITYTAAELIVVVPMPDAGVDAAIVTPPEPDDSGIAKRIPTGRGYGSARCSVGLVGNVGGASGGAGAGGVMWVGGVVGLGLLWRARLARLRVRRR